MKTKNEIQYSRMIRYFVEAACSIVDEEGERCATARNIAARAGYNVATLYNYFENLSHLLYFVHVRDLKDYAMALPEATRGITHPILLYMKVWECFNSYAFRRPQSYLDIFFGEHNQTLNQSLQLYYEAFPEELPPDGLQFYPMFKLSDIHGRDYTNLLEAARQGLLAEQDVRDASLVNSVLFGGMLRRFLFSDGEETAAEMARLTTRYQAHTLIGFGISKGLLEEYL